jgi:hypothetical protein
VADAVLMIGCVFEINCVVGLGLWEAMPVIGKSEDKAARCLKAAMQWCLFWCAELSAGNRIFSHNVLN